MTASIRKYGGEDVSDRISLHRLKGKEKKMELEWEYIDNWHKRAKIPGGWLVKAYEDIVQPSREFRTGWDWRIAMCFVPDPNYEWK
jgi:hypothetical protein